MLKLCFYLLICPLFFVSCNNEESEESKSFNLTFVESDLRTNSKILNSELEQLRYELAWNEAEGSKTRRTEIINSKKEYYENIIQTYIVFVGEYQKVIKENLKEYSAVKKVIIGDFPNAHLSINSEGVNNESLTISKTLEKKQFLAQCLKIGNTYTDALKSQIEEVVCSLSFNDELDQDQCKSIAQRKLMSCMKQLECSLFDKDSLNGFIYEYEKLSDRDFVYKLASRIRRAGDLCLMTMRAINMLLSESKYSFDTVQPLAFKLNNADNEKDAIRLVINSYNYHDAVKIRYWFDSEEIPDDESQIYYSSNPTIILPEGSLSRQIHGHIVVTERGMDVWKKWEFRP